MSSLLNIRPEYKVEVHDVIDEACCLVLECAASVLLAPGIILLIVGVLTSWFGVGAIVLLVCQILNLIEAVKLFKGDITTDAYGRTLYQEF